MRKGKTCLGRILAAGLALTCCVWAIGCREHGASGSAAPVGADRLLEAILASQEALPPARVILRTDVPENSSSYLGASLAAKLYGAPEEQIPLVLERLQESRLRLCDRLCGCEIHILKGRYAEDTVPLLALCRARLELLQKRELQMFLQEDYERYVAGGRVYERNGWVFLLLLPDPSAAVSAIDRLL